MDIWEIRREINKAKKVLTDANNVANEIAYLLPGRLKYVDCSILKKLKTELKNYNIHTCRWKDEP